ncbi:MAG: hypothetical protein IPO65_19970 [Saprospiraceae bacterium]|nr:hypothetical protein [Saprospiraceae bacterium]
MLLFCILLNVVVAIIFKVFPRFNIDVKRAIIVNYFTCVATAWAADYAEFNTHLPLVKDFVVWTLPMGILFFMVFLVIGKTVATYGVLVATTSQKLSLILPVAIALLFLVNHLPLGNYRVCWQRLEPSFILMQMEAPGCPNGVL